MGGKCQWDPATDDMVKATLDLKNLCLVLVVFFVSLDDEEEVEED